MLSLACVVVNDGSFIGVVMQGSQTVNELKKAIKEEAMYGFPAHDFTLFLGKTASGQWLHLSVRDLAKLNDGDKIDAVESLLTNEPMDPKTPLNSATYDICAPGADEIEAVRILVVAPAHRWRKVTQRFKWDRGSVVGTLQCTKALSTAFHDFGGFPAAMLMPQRFKLDRGSVVDLATAAEGTLQCTKALSTAFHDFGGFPTAIFVRKEMQMVWTILHDNYVGARPRDVHYVLMGSPGVGKSALLLLFCCYLATHHGLWIFFSRGPQRGTGCTHTETLLIFRGSLVTAFPGFVASDLDVMRRNLELESQRAGKRFLVVGDGYRQENLTGDFRVFLTSHLLATSAHFERTWRENRKLLALPAWSRSHLDALATALNMQDGDERYWYSGGSVREFQRDLVDLKRRLQTALWPLAYESDLRVADGYAPDPLNDSIRRLFVPRLDDAALYTQSSQWLYIVDIPGALQRLVGQWQLKNVAQLRKYAESHGNESLDGQMFEVLVHQLAHDKVLKLVVEDSHNVGGRAKVNMTPNFAVKMDTGDDDNFTEAQKWSACLAFLPEKAMTKMYWCPGYLQDSAVDSVLISGGVVHFLRVTVASTYTIDWAKLREMHEAVRAKKNLKKHQFKFVVVTPRKTSWEGYKDMTSEIAGMAMCTAHVNVEFDE